jgi:hypothetical protein
MPEENDMCYKGHLGTIGITGLEPKWERAVYEKRNELLGALYAAVPQGASFEDVIDPEFEKIDALLATLLNKLRNSQ